MRTFLLVIFCLSLIEISFSVQNSTWSDNGSQFAIYDEDNQSLITMQITSKSNTNVTYYYLNDTTPQQVDSLPIQANWASLDKDDSVVTYFCRNRYLGEGFDDSCSNWGTNVSYIVYSYPIPSKLVGKFDYYIGDNNSEEGMSPFIIKKKGTGNFITARYHLNQGLSIALQVFADNYHYTDPLHPSGNTRIDGIFKVAPEIQYSVTNNTILITPQYSMMGEYGSVLDATSLLTEFTFNKTQEYQQKGQFGYNYVLVGTTSLFSIEYGYSNSSTFDFVMRVRDFFDYSTICDISITSLTDATATAPVRMHSDNKQLYIAYLSNDNLELSVYDLKLISSLKCKTLPLRKKEIPYQALTGEGSFWIKVDGVNPYVFVYSDYYPVVVVWNYLTGNSWSFELADSHIYYMALAPKNKTGIVCGTNSTYLIDYSSSKEEIKIEPEVSGFNTLGFSAVSVLALFYIAYRRGLF